MAHFKEHKQQGTFTFQSKIYVWVYDSDSGKLIVKNSGEDLFFVKPYLESSSEQITNDYVKDKLFKCIKYGTPTPEINKSEPYDGIDIVPEE